MNTLSFLWFALAAFCEIGGCYAVYAWLRLGASAWWLVPGTAALAAFAWLLTLPDLQFAGRAYAAYGGVYVAASLLWFMLVERGKPDAWDFLGVALCLAGTLVLVLSHGPRGA